MVITRITAGLGNQLFQYALGRSLSLRTGTPLYFDLSYYKYTYATDTPRSFKLHHFNIDYAVLNASPYRFVAKATRFLPGRTLKPLIMLVSEKQFQFDERVLSPQAKFITLDGFWQSERYFANHADQIRSELTFARQTSPLFDTYKDVIDQTEIPVSLHIRRGDLVSHPDFSKTVGFIGLDYYREAVALLKARFPGIRLFVFSDDPDWVKENLLLDADPVFVVNSGPDADIDDLQLMSSCKHHIIANSTFSWWGAWLNPSPDKVVIAPKTWFCNKPELNTADLIPESWLQL
jgi:hypothetical protein